MHSRFGNLHEILFKNINFTFRILHKLLEAKKLEESWASNLMFLITEYC